MLSSDVLERQFGPTTLRVIAQTAQTRTSSTEVTATGQVLEVSTVDFIQDGIDAFPDIHQEVVAGKSMGKAFREHSVPFMREVTSTTPETAPSELSDWFGTNAPVTVICVRILVGTNKIPYANILETYTAEVKWK